MLTIGIVGYVHRVGHSGYASTALSGLLEKGGAKREEGANVSGWEDEE